MAETIVDAHHHIWRQADLAWLRGPMQPRIFGEYAPIMRDYPIEEYRADAEPFGVARSIYVQANWPAGQGLAEAQWVQSESDRTGFPVAIVGYADLGAPDAGQQLQALRRVPGVRGIRQQLHWHEKPMYRFASRPDLVNDAAWRAGFAQLAQLGLVFELQVFASQMADGARLAADHPQASIVLEHAGMLEDRSEAGWREWRAGMKQLAACPNVSVKLSGLGTFVHEASAATMRPVIEETVALFGADRCMYGSNFPIEKIWCSYAQLFEAFQDSIRNLDAGERAAVLAGTATRVYRLG